MGDYTSSIPSLLAARKVPASDWALITNLMHAIVDSPTSYTPTWSTSGTAPALGNGTLQGNYTRLGTSGLIFFRFTLVGGSTTTFGTGSWSFTLPTGIAQPTFVRFPWTGTILDSGSSTFLVYGDFGGPNFLNPGTGTTYTAVTATSPMTWTTNDRLQIGGFYFGA
jgi:hypothetical protein